MLKKPLVRLISFLFPISCALNAHAIGVELEEVQHLYKIGVPALAMRILDLHQPPINGDSSAWEKWERLRFEIYSNQHNDKILVERYGNLPDNVSADFRDWAVTLAANSYLAHGNGAVARKALLSQIWSHPLRDDKEQMRQWRFYIISSYLNERKLDDAGKALDFYTRNYDKSSSEVRILQARYFLLRDTPEKVNEVLGVKDSGEAYALYLYAQLLTGKTKPVDIMNAALKAANKDKESDANKYRFWIISARAGLKAEYYEQFVTSLERATGLLASAPMDSLFYHNPDRLWRAYESYARFLGGSEGLIIQQSDAWMALAEKHTKKRPVRARAVYAFMTRFGSNEEHHIKANKEFVKSLSKQKESDEIIKRLYIHSSRYSDIVAIPVAVRRFLADMAVKDGDIKQASRLINNLEDDEQDKGEHKESLRRARIHIMAGNTGEGIDIIDSILSGEEAISQKQLDRIMQVIFDLQAVEEHVVAVTLFEKIYKRSDNDKRKREILYWMADSRRALGEFDEAARLYLRSAYMIDSKATDLWAESARYQSARALSDGGYLDDARVLYNRLLRNTADPGHKQVLKQELDRLKFRR